MSGHSKWSQIKRQKGISDQKRGQAFTKLAATITLAVRQGGGITDPAQNFKLRLAIEKARSINMPKDNIERALRRAQSKQDAEVEEVVYEGFAPGGVAVIVEAATDKKTRTTGEIKNVFDKNGATLGIPGSVSYQFQLKGLIITQKNNLSTDEIFLIAADNGAEDIEEVEEDVFIYTKADEVARVKEKLETNGLIVKEFELVRKPVTVILVRDKETEQKIISFLEKLENLDDVQKVYANFESQEV